MLSCLSACRKHDVSCPVEECRLFIPSEEHLNCIQEFIDSKAGDLNNHAQTNSGMEKKGDMDPICTLQEIGDVFGVTRERARQVEAGALKRLSKRLKGFKL